MTPATTSETTTTGAAAGKLVEASVFDVIAAIERDAELPEQTRRHWVCSLRQIAKGLDRPAEVIPARWMAVRLSIAQLHHARIGVTVKTLSNHRSNVKAALRWFADEYDIPQHGAQLRPDWARFYEAIDKRIWERISNFARFCAGRGIGPSEVNDRDVCYLLALPLRNDEAHNSQRRKTPYGQGMEYRCSYYPRWAAVAAHGTRHQKG